MEDSIIHEQPLVDTSIETDTETDSNVKETDFFQLKVYDSINHEQSFVDSSIKTDTETESDAKETDFVQLKMPSNTSLSDITKPNNNENKKENPKKVTNRTKRSSKDQKRFKKIDDMPVMPVNDQPKIKIQYVDIKTVRKSENGQQGQNDSFNFVKLAVKKTVQTGPEGFDVLVEKDGLHISHLVRNSFKVLANCIHKIELGEVVTKTKIITGPPGCGKSSTVYQTIHLCLDLNWIVFYIPKCEILLQNGKTLSELENTCEGILEFLLKLNPAFKELTFPYDESTFENYIRNGIRNGNCVVTLLKLMTRLQSFQERKVLFAFDRWNTLLVLDDKVIPEFNSIAKVISNQFTFTVLNGFAIFCTSSSFKAYSNKFATNPFPESFAENENNFVRVCPYNQRELMAMMTYMKDEEFFPTDILNKIELSVIIDSTGCVPRHVRTLVEFCESKPSNADSLIPPEERLKNQLNEKFLEFYKKKITKLLDQCEEITKKENLTFLFNFAINDETSPTKEFIDEGLFIKDNNKCHPLCKTIRIAVVKYFASDDLENLKTIARDESIKWRALELFLIRSFICQKQAIQLANNEQTISIEISNIIHQTEEDLNLEAAPITKKSIIICLKNHKVCDLVILTKNNDLLFIQISTSQYNAHKSKREDLFSPLYIENGRNVSVIEHYCKLSGKNPPAPNSNKTTFDKLQIYYFYITTSDQRSCRNEYVNILNRDYLITLTNWDQLENYFIKK